MTMTRLQILFTYLSNFLFFLAQISYLERTNGATLTPTKKVAVFGATGRVGQLVVNELLNGRRNCEETT